MNTLTQILDPDPSDAAVVGQVLGARGDVNYDEYGSVALTAGQTEVTVSFLYEKEDEDYRFEYLYVEDPNVNPEDIRAVVNLKTKYGFTVQLSGAPDTNLSVLRWHVMSPDPLHVTQPPTSQPRYVLLEEGQPYHAPAFGILGDDATDNTAAIDALVSTVIAAGGGVIFFPPGEYRTSGNVIENDSVSFEGVGYASVIRNTHPSNPTLQLGSVSGGANYSQIRNLLFHPAVVRDSGAYEIVSHSANDIELSDLWFFEIWGGIKLGRPDAQYGSGTVKDIRASDFHQLLYTTRFHDGKFSRFVLGAMQSDANHIIVEGGCDALTFDSIEMTNGGAINLWIRAVDYAATPPRFIRFSDSYLDGADVALRQDNGDFNTFTGCFIDNGIVINGGANTRFNSCEVYDSVSHGAQLFGGGYVSFTDFIARGCAGDGLQILNGFVGGCSIVGGKFEGCAGNGIFIATGVEDVFLSNETYFTGNAVDITNNATSASVLLPERFMTWTALPLSNGWVDIGPPYFFAQYARGATGLVYLRGVVKDGDITYPTIIGTLPAGFRPASNIVFTVPFGSGLGAIQVGADGAIRVNIPGPDDAATFLDGIMFVPA